MPSQGRASGVHYEVFAGGVCGLEWNETINFWYITFLLSGLSFGWSSGLGGGPALGKAN
jgi:hypothetical protein